ncbi:choice-of-anchor M domain-containing protein [Amycolatopsis sp. PS_44_ISF1]|uniref:choice-of-anchor M domain-containing protein n=1 Tax=Amycolatopsis sp. PS_44_ISF1 TaxID=2974917 RepID=UPI0028DDF50B|nr:choice-of-anchor M domain-containing protein [Amycolatopsis sp. PS_44_ISF1]MDT8914958.1 choice-of-anchor M domain-containing protein [Amycolatopsis sp. PS_44_ISF1]
MTALSGTLCGVLALALGPAGAGPAAAPSSPPGAPLAQLAVVTVDDSAVRVRVTDGVDPAGVVLHARAWTAVTDGAGGLPGWDTTDLPANAPEVRWTLDSVQGPGRFLAYTGDGDQVVTRFDSAAAKIGGPQTYAMPAGSQGDFGWVFDTPGRYRVAFSVAATLGSGRSVVTPAVYTADIADMQAPSTLAPSPTPTTTGEEPVPGPAPARAAVAAGAPQVREPGTPTGDTASGRVVLGEGHVDALAPRLVDGKFQIQVKDGTQARKVTWRRPADVVFQVRPAARFPLPGRDQLAFAGRPGDLVYLIPQVQQDGVVWAGWSTEALTARQIAGPVTYALTAVEGPAPVAIFTTGTFGDEKLLLGNSPGTPTTMPVPLATHAHANWIFPKDGIYRLTFTLTARAADGGTYTDTQTYGFAVGNADPARAFESGTRPGGPDSPGGAQAQPRTGSGPAESAHPALARTGVGVLLPLGAAGVLLGGGAGLVLFANRRRAHRGGVR